MRQLRKLAIAAAVASACAFATSAQAGYIRSDQFTVYDGTGAIRYQFGVTEDGTGFGGALCVSLSTSAGCLHGEQDYDGTNLYTMSFWYLPVDLADPNKASNVMQLVEANGSISDIVFMLVDVNANYLVFASDGDAGGLPDFSILPNVSVDYFTETDNPFDVTSYLATALQAAGWTATFQSADIYVDTPEPGTFTILGLGLAGLGFARRRKAA